MDDQERMEAYLAKTMVENNVDQKDSINGKMQTINVGCSYKEKSITLGFPVQKWQVNRAGMFHGGLICTAFDITMAAVSRFCVDEHHTPTVSMDVKYIRPVQVGDVMIVKAQALHAGRRMIQMTCEAHSRDTGKLVATGASIYIKIT